jgi:GTP-binding protein HflX
MLMHELKGFLVGLEIKGKPSALNVDASLEELALLADTAGIHVVGQTYQRVDHPNPSTFIGKGKVEEIERWLEELDVDIVIFDDELSPRHQRELEEIFGDDVRVIDRTALILDIFAQHAQTREGATQVTLAQYEYRLPRLTRQWTHLARQAGGGAARGGAGGVGLRGPGETQLETDRREIRRRIARLKDELEQIRAHRSRHRKQRQRTGTPVVALVGYTNAGKSTLLNRLSGASVYVADQLFATLDPTIRRVVCPSGREILFSDTVGFIQKLPHSLVAAFRATLEEITHASALLHVVDCSHPNALEQAQIVERTLVGDLEITDVPVFVALNKIDLLTGEDDDTPSYHSLLVAYPDAVAVSALTGYGIDALVSKIDNTLLGGLRRINVQIPYTEGGLIARFYELAIVESETHAESSINLVGFMHPRDVGPYEAYLTD